MNKLDFLKISEQFNFIKLINFFFTKLRLQRYLLNFTKFRFTGGKCTLSL